MTDEPVAFSVGAILGSGLPESGSWATEIRRMTRAVRDARRDVRSPLNVNVVFLVPSRHEPNEFVGVRTGHFSKRSRELVVQAAIPAGPSADYGATVSSLPLDAVNAAEVFAKMASIAFGLPEVRTIAREAAAQL